MNRDGFLKKWILKNGSYKLVALFVALVLWVAILGRKDFVLTQELPLRFQIPQGTVIANDVSKRVRVKVGGPRLALKRFSDQNEEIVINLKRAGIGRTSFRIQENDFRVPQKVRLIAVSPSFVSVEIRRPPKEEIVQVKERKEDKENKENP